MKLATRMQSVQPYFFAKLAKRMVALQAAGRDVIRLDVGSPDQPPAAFIRDALKHAVDQPGTHGYVAAGGLPEFRQAVAAYDSRRFGVAVDPQNQVEALIGSKEGLFHLSMAYLEPGDVALVPDPAYAVYEAAARFAGADVVLLPLRAEHGFLPQLAEIAPDAARRAKLLWLNYPNNPTGACAPLQLFTEAVAFAQRNDLLVCHDAPYLDVTYDGYTAPSILQVPGALEVAVEFNSLSKTYNMAGWRMGMAVGCAAAVRALHALKSNIDSSQFKAAQLAGVAALTGDQTWLAPRNALYQERRDAVLAGLRQAQLPAETPAGAMYVWAQVPAGMGSERFADDLLEQASVSVTPGAIYGVNGEGYFRISLGTATPRVREAMERIAEWARAGS